VLPLTDAWADRQRLLVAGSEAAVESPWLALIAHLARFAAG
jgi:hypothetical protein